MNPAKSRDPLPTARAWPWQLRQRSQRAELLDAEQLPVVALHRNLKELAAVNRLLGGYAPTLQGLSRLMPTATNPQGLPWQILDVGCGGGDTLAQVHAWAQSTGRQVELTGVDLLPECIAFARNAYGHLPIRWQVQDYSQLTFAQKAAQNTAQNASENPPEQVSLTSPAPPPPDLVISALFCHHLPPAQLLHFLRWTAKVARQGFVINDLHRHPLAYYGIDLISRWPGCSQLFQNDARLSVWRGYRREDWVRILAAADVVAQIRWAWAFRWLLVGYCA